MQAQRGAQSNRPPINGRYRIPFSVWSIVFRFAASTSYFTTLERSPFEPVVYDESGQVISYDREVRNAYDHHKTTMMALLGVCREWREVLRHYRMEWTVITERNTLAELLRHPTEPGFLPIHRLDLQIALLTGPVNTRSTARNLATLLSCCERLEVLTIISSDYDAPNTTTTSDLYIERLVPVLSTRPMLQKLASNLPIGNFEPVFSLLNESESLATLDICARRSLPRVVASSPARSITSLRISFDEVSPQILHAFADCDMPNLAYVWYVDYVDPTEDPNHALLTAAFDVFLRAQGQELRSLVLVTNAYSLTMEMWTTVLRSCPALAEFCCTVPLDPGFTYGRPPQGLPHAALHTVILNGIATLTEAESAPMRSEASQFLLSLPTPDFPILRTIRLDISLRTELGEQVRLGSVARGLIRPLLRACDARRMQLQDKQGETLLSAMLE
ncbi:hypothetical protein CALCODRAFT_509776 [Calocera cornea HHB12733]|uniref:Uncharacterized protein n=1 Tax=Calocera cornea HHB12733 TaxID=1353952 RepID=A0A165F075_9BASI|nr:hypothetical protein CALCODRAFT_509776 [Calocera cornea HHB12733]